MEFLKGNCFIPAPHGRLEAIYKPIEGAVSAALVLHPHPLHAGTMHNKVVYRTAKALQDAGYETLRFNFRGVGQSTGGYDNGVGETDDARVALDYLLEQYRLANHQEPREVIVAGFSFGSLVGLRLGCVDQRVDRLIAIGVPARMGNLDLLQNCRKPILFLHGEEDEIAPLQPLREVLEQLPFQLVTIPGAGHFFDRQAAEMMAAVTRFVT
jgi:uncharacterized protein